jgi:cardiolipin synthase A/B
MEEAFFRQRDLSLTIAGPLAAELAETFDHDWQEQGGTTTPPLSREPPAGALPNAARLVATGPDRHDLADAVYTALDHARHHVYVENVYFSDAGVVNRLAKARRRGADVRAVLTVASNSDVYNRVNRVTANRLLRAGVRVYLYPGMTHVKAAAVDGCWAYAGTGNFDPLSMRHDRELGVAVGAGPAIAELEERLFLPAFRDEWELKEPLPISAHDRALDLLAGLFL